MYLHLLPHSTFSYLAVAICKCPLVHFLVTTCPELKIAHGILSHYGPLPVGDSVNVTCQPGFKLNGTKQLTCLQGRVYNQPVPECVGK